MTNNTVGIFQVKEDGCSNTKIGDPCHGVAGLLAKVDQGSGRGLVGREDAQEVRGGSTCPCELNRLANDDADGSVDCNLSENAGGQGRNEREGSKEGLHCGMRVASVTDEEKSVRMERKVEKL